MNSHIPTKIITKRNQTPWINIRIKQLHKRKQRAFNTHRIHRNQAGHDTSRKARKHAHTETRKAHRRYIASKTVFTTEITNFPKEPYSNISAMPDITITTKGVAKLLHELKTNTSTGPDDVPARILQLAANELDPAFRVNFQRSITTDEFPLSCLQANITPIFKKGDRTLPSNYRPISLTSICCKLLEHIIYSNITDHLDHHSVLFDKPSGGQVNTRLKPS